MADPKQRTIIAERVERHRRDLGERTDVSQAMRRLSQSSSRNPIGPPKRKPRAMTTTLLIAVPAVLAMVICVAAAAVTLAGNLWLQSQLNDPTTTVQKYYAAIGQRNYSEAYSYFSSHLKAEMSEAAFNSTWSSYDTVDGVVSSYSVTGNAVNSQNATLTLAVVRRGRDTAQVQTVSLVKENGGWHIDNIDIGSSVPIPTPSA